MNKKLFVLLTVVSILMMPSVVSAQTEPCNVLYLGHSWDMANNQLLIAVEVQNAYSVSVDVIIDGIMIEYHTIIFDGGTHLWEITTYIADPHIEQTAFEIDLIVLAFNTMGHVVFDDRLSFNVIIMQQMEIVNPEPLPDIKHNPEWQPNEINYDILTQAFATVLIIGWGGCIIGGLLTPKKRKRKANNESWRFPSVKDSIDTEVIAKLVDNQISEAQLLTNKMTEEFAKEVAELEERYKEKMLSIPQDDAPQLPDLSNEEDGYDWRTCPYCGEWNSGKSIRCNYCDGKLGRPLG